MTMTADFPRFDQRELVSTAPWSPSDSLRSWLAVGIGALLIELVLVVASMVLALRHWGKPGLTPDVILDLASVVPAACTLVVYLRIARETSQRGLWKSAAGLLLTYLVGAVLGLTFEGSPRSWTLGCNLVAVAGLAVLLWFSLSKRPKIGQSFAASEAPATTDADQEEEGAGCLVHIAAGLAIFGVKLVLRGRGLPKLGLGLDDWSLLLGAVLLLFGFGYGVWFAIAKIRLWRLLGGMAAVVGGAELVFLVVRVGLLAGVAYLAFTAPQNPPLADDAMKQLLDPWLRTEALAGAVCRAGWIGLTGALFTTLWMRPRSDWREAFYTGSSPAA